MILLAVLVSGCRGRGADEAARVGWVRIEGGSFEMGSPQGVGDPDERPRHRVEVPTFELMRTEVDVQTWDACVAAGACDPIPPDPPKMCRDRAPSAGRGCLDWPRAVQVCDWLGGRLPTEAEWEFAARSRGEDRTYPWGEAAPTCALAVLGYADNDPCGESGAAAPCSRPGGETAQGLCDMAGNLYEWVRDPYHDTYDGAPADGSVWKGRTTLRALRGGGINSDEPVRTTNRAFHEPTFTYSGSGARCARTPDR